MRPIWEEIKKSLLLAIVGLIFLPAAFFLVHRAANSSPLGRLLGQARPVAQASAGDLIYVSGNIKAEMLGDPLFVEAGHYLRLERRGEIYAWKQVDESGATPPRCVLEWTNMPDQEVHKKPGCSAERKERNYGRKYFLDADRNVQSFSLKTSDGEFMVAGDASYQSMPPARIKRKQLLQPFKEQGDHFLIDSFCIDHLEAECERVRWQGVAYDPQAVYTVLGKLAEGTIVPYETSGGPLLIVGSGDWSFFQANLAPGYRYVMIAYFCGALLLLWLGLIALARPLLKLLEFIPVLGRVGATVLRFLFLAFALLVVGLCFLFLDYWYMVPVAFVVLTALLLLLTARRLTTQKSAD